MPTHFIRAGAACAALLAASSAAMLSAPRAAFAQSLTAITGTVTRAGAPAAGIAVTLSGGNLTRTTRSDGAGTFAFAGLTVGSYVVSVTGPAGVVSAPVDLGSGGVSVTLAVDSPVLRKIGNVNVTRRAAASGGGTDTIISTQAIAHSPHSGSLPEMLLQTPGAARGANGVVHINGDHGDINYVIDGVQLPIEINRAVGTEFDPSDVAFAEVLNGAYPAQYGNRFGAVVNIGTRQAPGAGGYGFEFKGGAYGLLDSTLTVHRPIAGGGSVVAGVRSERDGRALDPATQDAPHAAGSNASQFVRLTLPRGADFLNVTATHALQTYQVPPDLSLGQPAQLDDNAKQDDTFASVQYRHTIGDRGALSFGPSVKRSRLRDLPDFANDTKGAPNCAADVTACAQSIFADRTSTDYQFNLDYANRSSAHEVRFGGAYDASTVRKRYAVTLQAGNPFSAAPFTLTDTAPNTGHTEGLYLQDAWKLSARVHLDAGLRADAFQLASTEFRSGSFMLSPRLKLTVLFGPRSSVYGYYGRFFTPYSFENVSPTVAAQLIPPVSGIESFDLLPQRDSVYELGGRTAVGAWDLGVRAMQKNATDIIDDVQVGASNLHQDINFRLGRLSLLSAYAQRPLAGGGRAYVSLTRTYAVVKECETQLLQPCAGGAALDWTPADHDQRWSASGGVQTTDRRGGYLSWDFEYGSGLTTAPSDTRDPANPVLNPYCPPDPRTGVGSTTCKVPPHLTFDVEKGFAAGRGGSFALGATNLLNDRYAVTAYNAQGNHSARPRSVYVKYSVSR